MMSRDIRGMDDYLKIHHIKTKVKLNVDHGITKNFEEFRRVYGWVLNQKFNENDQSGARRVQKNVRPLIDLKTIRMEMPLLGAERAIIQPKAKPVTPILKKAIKNVKTEEKNTITSTEHLVKKLTQLEAPKRKEPPKDLKQNPNSFIEEANREIDIAAEQLQQIKQAMQEKPAEISKRPKTPLHKPKKKSRHTDCVRKKYLTTLSVMQQKLQTLEKKYFGKPKITYKSVNDTFTQSSDVETIFEKTEFKRAEPDQGLEGIMTDLDELMKADVTEKYRHHEPRDLTFHEPRYEGLSPNVDRKKTDTNVPRRISIHDPNKRDMDDGGLVNKESLVRSRGCINPEGKRSSTVKKRSSTNSYRKMLLEDSSARNMSSRNCSPTPSANFNEYSHNKEMRRGDGTPRRNMSSRNCSPTPSANFNEHSHGNEMRRGDGTPRRNMSSRNCSPTPSANFNEYSHGNEMRRGDGTPRRNLSFKKCDSPIERHNSISAVIDATESQMKKYRCMKQDIIDVETFCDRMCKLTEEEDHSERELRHNTPVAGERGPLNDSQLRKSVMKSCFLTKEFDPQPKISYFCENDYFFRKNKLADVSEDCSDTSVKTIKKLIRSLNSALDNSIYQAIDTE